MLDKTALVTASSDVYSQHFALIAQRFHDPVKAYSIIEQVRGRVTRDLLMAGSVTSNEGKRSERAISQLRLKLMRAHSNNDVRSIRDQIFMLEQSRWATPEVSILKANSDKSIGLDRVQPSIGDSTVILEYVLADPRSFCLIITSSRSHIIPLPSKARIETLVGAYLKAIKAKQPARSQARQLYDALLRPIPEAVHKENLVVVRDG